MLEPELPRETCPAIDSIIAVCKREVEDIKQAIEIEDNPDELKTIMGNVSYALSNIIYEIEDLRKANARLRDYGEYWKDKYDSRESEAE